ncbi:MAG: hypothetical protein LBG62_03420 [Candidatus Methanoplasma sp.]|jgi:predicted RNA binding protein with dsRBD fold (UPF0201 family)|nr:hypothetical protein [Candidatus Methanoplasma sp.]
MASAEISCPVYPTEDPAKVRDAVMRIFPTADLSEEGGRLSGTADLEAFSKLIRRQKILDSARSSLIRGIRGGRTVVYLNKQVATVGKVSFTDPRPILGAIEVSVADEDIQGLIDRVAPATVDGEEVRP